MQAFMEYKRKRAEALAESRFASWLADPDVALDRAFDFMPVMALFIMGFRDMNLWVIRFDEEAEEHFRSIINGNTYEDETHSRLFLEDWRKLGFDDALGWRASDTLWWLFVSPELEVFRRYQVAFVELVIDDGGDPMLRFAHSEAGEACGHVFFRAAVGPATRLEEKTGTSYRYFGRYHLDRELGHVMESEGEFETQVLDADTRARAQELGARMFDIFEGIFDAFYDYVQTYVKEQRHPTPSWEMRLPALPVPESLDLGIPAGVAIENEPVLNELQQRKRIAAQHPLYTWLRDAPVPAADKLRAFLPLWTMDILGYRDLNHYVLRYSSPQGPREEWINGWVCQLETHSQLFLPDWRALGLDEHLGWTAEQTLEFCFLDPSMDVHRKNIFAFIKLGLRHPSPVLRFWLLHALESSGDAFFEATSVVARQAEREGTSALDYLADRHDPVHPPGLPAADDIRSAFLAVPLSDEPRRVASHMIDVVFDALEEQLDLSWQAVRENRFGVAGATQLGRSA